MIGESVKSFNVLHVDERAEYADRIYAARIAQGLGPAAFARAMGCCRQAVYQWEKGTSLPRRGKQQKLARLFGVPALTPPRLSAYDRKYRRRDKQ